MAELIAFYSRGDENYVNGTLRQLKVGNTEAAALILRELTGADLFQIRQAKPYDKGYNRCIQEAREDQRRNARPELLEYPESLEAYDTIYLGYPNYWGTMPMAVFTFLERFDLKGKVIRPFCTHEGSGLGRSLKDIQSCCPGAQVKEGLAIRGGAAGNSRQELAQWLEKAE